MFRQVALLLTILLPACGPQQGAQSQSKKDLAPGAIVISDAWARPTIGAGSPAAVYLKVSNNGTEDDRLTGASTEIAGSTELHSMAMEGEMIRMRALPELIVPAGGSAALEPGGNHIMLMDLKRELVVGDSFDLALSFEKAGEMQVSVSVVAR